MTFWPQEFPYHGSICHVLSTTSGMPTVMLDGPALALTWRFFRMIPRRSAAAPRLVSIPTVFLAAVALLALATGALAQASWEMRICADPDNYPTSSRDRPGFDNRIAEILADELQAETTFVWTPFGPNMVRRFLWPGQCDVVFGVTDGTSGLLNTIPYYRAPYVFVTRRDRPFEIASLDDETLRGLRIATYPSGAPFLALFDLGLNDNLVLLPPAAGAGRSDHSTPMIDALRGGAVDVAVLYASEAAAFVERYPDELALAPVTPEITLSGLQMFRIWTIGVRPGDAALRDRLNTALARRWDEVQAIVDAYGLPLQSLPRPRASEAPETPPLRVGVVLPLPTGDPAITDVTAEAARFGALTADDLVGREASAAATPLEILFASAPDAAASTRAAERLVTTEGVTALVGGLDDAQAEALAAVAAEQGVLFFNIGTVRDDFRTERCRPTSFHVEASAAMYLDGLTSWFTASGHRRWFLVAEDSEPGEALLDRARKALLGEGEEVGSVVLTAEPRPIVDEIERLREAAPDIVLLLLSPKNQEFFLSQYVFNELGFPVVGFPEPITQTRDFYTRLRQVAPDADTHLSLWETTLSDHGADDLNRSFIARSGAPMDSAGWASYAAVKIVHDAVVATGSREVGALIDYLESPGATFDVGKGPAISFRPWDHQLRQPLYLVEVDADAEWGRQVSSRIALASLRAELPEPTSPADDAVALLDGLGDGASETACRL